MLVHVGAAYGSELFKRFMRRVGAMNILGDIWAQAQRDYFSDKLYMDDILGSPRIYLGIQSLFGGSDRCGSSQSWLTACR